MSAPQAARATGYVPTLDGWRAVSVLAVILYHATPKDSNAFIDHGQKGVMVFFAISGYLITLRLLDEAGAGRGIDLRGFYIRRVFRILPPAYLCLSVLVLLSACGSIVRVHAPEVLGSALFVRNIWPRAAEVQGWYTAHFWSLAVEEQFYLFWPLVMSFGTRSAQRFSLLLILTNGAWRAIATRYWLDSLPSGLTQPAFDYIMWGCWWALVFQSPAWRERCRRALSFPVWCAVVLITAAVAHFKPTGVSSLLAMLISVIVVGTVLRPETWLGQLLELKLVRWVGRLSYGLYLWQQLFVVSYSFAPRTVAQVFPLNLILLLGVTSLSYYAVERPLLALGRKLAASLRDRARMRADARRIDDARAETG